MDQEAQGLAQAIAAAVDNVLGSGKDTAILDLRRPGQAHPHLAVIVTRNQDFIPELIRWTKEKENAPPPRRCKLCGSTRHECVCANSDGWT